MQAGGDVQRVEALVERATALAAAWAVAAQPSTSVGQERAILRLLGVAGLDRAGRPLAAEVVDRYLAGAPQRLGDGIALPFAIAMAEYDLSAEDLALEAAAGNVDLALEAEMLEDPIQRARATALAADLATAALARVDANRTARRELLAVLGDRRRPLVGVSLAAPAVVDALDEVTLAVEAGAGLLRVEVPPSRELAEASARTGSPVEPWVAPPGSRAGLSAFDPQGQPTPTGSARAVGVLRVLLDEVGARRGGYVRLATGAPALSAPDQAVVAAFERVDLVLADPVREIVAGSVDPGRALADHAFAHRVLGRAGTRVLVPAGPLTVASDLAAGVPSDAATRSGRALALQLLGVALARHDGLPPEAVLVGALPEWLGEEPGAPARAVAEIAVRRIAVRRASSRVHRAAVDGDAALAWQALVTALLPDAGDVELLLCGAAPGYQRRAGALRAASSVAAGLAGARTLPELAGPASAHRDAMLAAAEATLRGLEVGGWGPLVDDPLGIARGRIGAEAVAERTGGFDALAPDVRA